MSLSYTQDKTGVLKAGSAKLRNQLTNNASAMLNDLGRGARDRVRKPLTKHTGDSLYNSVKVQLATKANLTVKTYTQSATAVLRELDTKAHVIKPKKAGGVLAFIPKRGRNVVFAKLVHHPGTKGTHSWQYANLQFKMRIPFAVKQMFDQTFQLKPYTKRYS
jgi:hypothetical protein